MLVQDDRREGVEEGCIATPVQYSSEEFTVFSTHQ